MKCAKCGVDLTAGGSFCHRCGEPIPGSGQKQLGAAIGSGSEPESPGKGSASSGKPASSATSRFDHAAGLSHRQDTPEDEVWSGSYSYKAMIGTWIGCALISAACFIGAIVAMKNGQGIKALYAAIAVDFLIWTIALLLFAYRRLNIHYRLTSHRFFHILGILSRTTNRIEVIDMDDITVRQGLIERMLGVGTITVTSSDLTHPKLVMPGIENVHQIAKEIDEARRRERVRRGVHIENV